MTSTWEAYPDNYRAAEVGQILAAARAGACLSVVGLSGAGKSNLFGFVGRRAWFLPGGIQTVLVDCNRLAGDRPADLFRLILLSLGETPDHSPHNIELFALEAAIGRSLERSAGLCLLLDGFDRVARAFPPGISPNLRALRDAFKYRLAYVTSTRRPLDPQTELAELFYGQELWLGVLSPGDALWSVRRDAARMGAALDEAAAAKLIEASWGYPAFLRAAGEAYTAGAQPESERLFAHPAVQRRLAEFWMDAPGPQELRQSGLEGHPWLERSLPAAEPSPAQEPLILTAKENRLLEYLRAHAGQVCEKDELIRAVWPEDRIFEAGVRDDSLAQLVRRLRKKIEVEPERPRVILTVPGRGYRLIAPNSGF